MIPFEKEMLELGRACVHVDFRNIMVLHALWKGIAVYATRHESRYLIGCSSVTSQDENYGMAMYDALKEKISHRSPAAHQSPTRSVLPVQREIPSNPLAPPRLFRAYLEISGRICGPPAIDREFKTIDFSHHR